MTNLFELFDKLSFLIYENLGTLNLEEGTKIGSINPSKLEKKKIKKVLFCLDLCKESVLHAIDQDVDVILVHQAFLIWADNKIHDELLSLAKLLLEKNKFVYFFTDISMLNNKLNEYLVQILNAQVDSPLNLTVDGKSLPVGRIAKFDKGMINIKGFLDFVVNKLNLHNVAYYFPDPEVKVDKFLILAGQPSNHDILKAIGKKEIKILLGEGLNFEMVHYCDYYGINFIDITRFGLNKAFLHLIYLLKFEMVDVEFLFFEREFSFNVYKKGK